MPPRRVVSPFEQRRAGPVRRRALDRASERRGDVEWLAAARADPRATADAGLLAFAASMLSAVMGFYEFHARDGVALARALVERARSGRGHYKLFPDGIAPARGRARV